MLSDSGNTADALRAERELVRLAQASDSAALTTLFEMFHPRVYSYGLHQFGNHHVAEDFASDVMLRVVESVTRYRDRGLPFAAWVFRIARNRLIDLRRRSKQRPEVQLNEDFLSGSSNTHASVEFAMARGEVQLSLPRLTESQRQVVILRFLEDCDVGTVARMLGRSESSVKSLQCRALRSLRRSISPGGNAPIGVSASP